MRMTVSLCVIMVEITNNLKFLPLIMLVLLISKVCILKLSSTKKITKKCTKFFPYRLLVMLLTKVSMRSRLS